MRGRGTPDQVNEQQAAYGAKEAESPLPFIDLFCGCGGFTLGMLRAGFRCLAAVDLK
jgi:tRNA/tmRNA/rRNA uracil-C5-methylase (TrmA/RlmC/RlmD family)